MKKSNAVPFEFVLETLQPCSPLVRPMFGCHAIYVGEKLVLILRNKQNNTVDNGVWVAIMPEHHDKMKRLFASLRPVEMFGSRPSWWLNIPAEADDFEESVFAVCEMVLKNDPRIGKVPKTKRAGTGKLRKR